MRCPLCESKSVAKKTVRDVVFDYYWCLDCGIFFRRERKQEKLRTVNQVIDDELAAQKPTGVTWADIIRLGIEQTLSSQNPEGSSASTPSPSQAQNQPTNTKEGV